jgi:DNA-binding SARP family transcriptional activator
VHDLKELGKRGLSPRHEDAIEFRILGPLEASRLGQPLEVGAGKQRALLALLLLRAGEVVSTDRLIDALWGEHPPPSALNSIHVYVSQLRKVLGNGRLETRGRGYLLALEPAQLDLARFEHLLRDGRELLTSGEPDRAANTLRGALGLWRGSPLSDVASVPFAEGEVARLEELRLVALEERIEADLALGRHAELVPELEGLIRDHPLRERLRAQLMLALYRSGRQSEALAAYQQARKMLSTELGLEPGRTLRELEAGILRHDPTLDPPAQTPGLPRSARRRRHSQPRGAAEQPCPDRPEDDEGSGRRAYRRCTRPCRRRRRVRVGDALRSAGYARRRPPQRGRPDAHTGRSVDG